MYRQRFLPTLLALNSLPRAGGREKSGVVSGRVEMFVRPFKSIAERRQAQAGQQVWSCTKAAIVAVVAQSTAGFCETGLLQSR